MVLVSVGKIHALQAMTNDSNLNMGNNIRVRDTQFFSMFWLKILKNQMKCQSNVFYAVFTNNVYPSDNMEEYRYYILALNMFEGFLQTFIQTALFGNFEQ